MHWHGMVQEQKVFQDGTEPAVLGVETEPEVDQFDLYLLTYLLLLIQKSMISQQYELNKHSKPIANSTGQQDLWFYLGH